MQIDKNYRIETDTYNFILTYESDPTMKDYRGEMKEIVSKDRWYYPSLKMCLKKYLEESLRPSASIIDVMDRIDFVEDRIDTIAGTVINVKC